MRELLWRADGRRKDEWNRTSLLAAIIFNRNRKPADCKEPNDFHPYHRRRSRRLTKANWSDLKVFLR